MQFSMTANLRLFHIFSSPTVRSYVMFSFVMRVVFELHCCNRFLPLERGNLRTSIHLPRPTYSVSSTVFATDTLYPPPQAAGRSLKMHMLQVLNCTVPNYPISPIPGIATTTIRYPILSFRPRYLCRALLVLDSQGCSRGVAR